MKGHKSDWTKNKNKNTTRLPPITIFVRHTNDLLRGVIGTEADGILYANDTICVSEDEEAMNRLLDYLKKWNSKEGGTGCA